MNTQNERTTQFAYPPLHYYGKNLVVDQAWVDTRQKRLLVDLEGCYFSAPLSVARQEGGQQLDECNLVPELDGFVLSDLWPLDCRGVSDRYRIAYRCKRSPQVKSEWEWEVF